MSRTTVGILLVSLGGLCGCQFSASASGSVKTGSDAEAEFTAEATTKPEPDPNLQAQSITFKQGKLEYRGVINFEYDKALLRNDGETQTTLQEFATFLQEHPDVSIEVEGHTDSRGSEEYNRELSDRRAASVRQWLIEHGVAEDRVTAVGKGEDDPSVPEPAECNNKRPVDTTPCEAAWAENRRVVFEVTRGAETLPEEPAAEPEPPAPEPEPVAVSEPKEECPWLWGGHLNIIGPNSWVMLAGAVQPGICWLEPSLGLGIGFGGIDAEDPPAGTNGDGRYFVLNIPLRARIWFMDRHSVIGDVGFALSRYWVSADMTDSADLTADYSRNSTNGLGHLGVGYGFRPNGAQAGFRLGAVIGALLPFGNLGDSSVDAGAGFNAAEQAALRSALDSDSDNLMDLEPYGEISLGWLF